jgi:phospholipase/carboxylesterase
MLDAIEIETGKEPRYSVIWMHGLGADGNDFVPIVPEIRQPDWPSVRFVFPHAPVRPVTINGGLKMRAWYDILGLEIANRQDEAGVRASIVEVEALVAREESRGIPSNHVVIAGFSQGGAIALAAGLRHAQPLGGIVALSTYLPLADRTEPELNPANRQTPVWMAHGESDPTIPHALGMMSREWLKSHGYAVDWHSYEMPHSVCPAEIAHLSRWLGARFRA